MYTRGDKMVVKDNCAIFDTWIVVSEQAIPASKQALSALIVPFTVNSGTVKRFKCLIKVVAKSLAL